MSQLSLYTWIIAVLGAVLTLAAALGRNMNFWSKPWSKKLYKAGYLLMFVSISLFVLKGFLT
jgi:hypothetical protein